MMDALGVLVVECDVVLVALIEDVVVTLGDADTVTELEEVKVEQLLIVGDVVVDRKGVLVGEIESVADRDVVREVEDVTSPVRLRDGVVLSVHVGVDE